MIKSSNLKLQAAIIRITITLSTWPVENPTMTIELDNLIDSGATTSAVKANEQVCTPTYTFVTTVGVAVIPMAEPMSKNSTLTIERSDVQHSLRISDKTPINLKG